MHGHLNVKFDKYLIHVYKIFFHAVFHFYWYITTKHRVTINKVHKMLHGSVYSSLDLSWESQLRLLRQAIEKLEVTNSSVVQILLILHYYERCLPLYRLL